MKCSLKGRSPLKRSPQHWHLCYHPFLCCQPQCVLRSFSKHKGSEQFIKASHLFHAHPLLWRCKLEKQMYILGSFPATDLESGMFSTVGVEQSFSVCHTSSLGAKETPQMASECFVLEENSSLYQDMLQFTFSKSFIMKNHFT